MFRICRFSQDSVLIEVVNTLGAAAPLAAGEWVWLHLENEPVDIEDRLFGVLGIHLDDLVLMDARRERHPPKYEYFENCEFLILRELQASLSGHALPETQGISVVLGDRFLVTRSFGHSVAAAAVLAELQQAARGRKRLEPTVLAYRLIRKLVDAYQPMLLAMEERLADIEDDLLNRPREEHLNQLMTYNSALKKLRRRLIYQTNALKRLMETGEGKRQHLFRDLYENSERYSTLCHLYQELMTDLINGYLSLSSHKMNNIMKVLTVVTVVFMPLTLIAGIYGMNFRYMPELEWHYGYFMVIGAMLVLVLALMLAFRKLRWL